VGQQNGDIDTSKDKPPQLQAAGSFVDMVRLKGDKEIGVIETGQCFGGISFLLSSPRVARAVALEDSELVAIRNENINKLMNEYPEFIIEVLREMALRLREANKVID
jgi:CRP-like cAMP-binding protein